MVNLQIYFVNTLVSHFISFFLFQQSSEKEFLVSASADNSKRQSGASESGNSACAARIMLNDSDPLLPSSGSPFNSAQQGETVQTSNAVSGKAHFEETYFFSLYFEFKSQFRLPLPVIFSMSSPFEVNKGVNFNCFILFCSCFHGSLFLMGV